RPGKGNAIFLTLEDEKGIANIIFWTRTFERYRPVIMGARFVRVTGKLQSESGVIHIVAEKIEDLTPWLTVLLEEAAGTGRADKALHQVIPQKQPPSTSPDLTRLSQKAGSVMPKGRNFQ